jgi:hypothetical protein
MLDFISDKLPREIVKPKSEWRSSATGLHVMGAVDNFNFHQKQHLIPVTHLRKICFTMGAEGHEPGSNKGIPACKRDGGVFPWFSHYCVRCGDFFLRDFYDPRFCAFYATCWDCLPQLPWASCTDHYGYDPSNYKTAPPVGLNPRKYSEQEIADAFSFLNE